jgi:two-component system phosphate regulon response regulator PhoB
MKGLTAPQKAEADRRSRTAVHILVVDDNTTERELLALHLSSAGYRVTCAEDAVAAGHRMAEDLPDLVIADFQMPFMNGIEFVAALRGDATIPDLPVIFLARAENRDQIAGRTFGFPLLTKPLVAQALLDTVAAQLRPRAP